MNTSRFALLLAFALLLPATSHASAPERDGVHDFDWMFGSWHATLRKLDKPLSGSTTWIEFEGTQESRPLLGGLANIDEFVVDNDTMHVKGVTLRLYDPETREWSIYWANARKGVLAMPPTVGSWDGKGNGEFTNREELDGKPIIVRYRWTVLGADSAHFEQAFSPDDGKTWETNWISDIRRVE